MKSTLWTLGAVPPFLGLQQTDGAGLMDEDDDNQDQSLLDPCQVLTQHHGAQLQQVVALHCAPEGNVVETG